MPNTLQTWLDWGTNCLLTTSESALLDAEILLCHCLAKNRSFLRAWPEQSMPFIQLQQYQQLISQRQHGTPIAYLTGQREFWSRNFSVNPSVLIPRPDSELLIELSLKFFTNQPASNILDLGTGSGILAITLAAELAQATVWATDLSPTALNTAKANAEQLNLKNIEFRLSDWLTGLPKISFDLIVSNPPYIAENDPHLCQGDLRYEPISALVSPENGLQDIRIITAQAREFLSPNGQLLIEHGYNQADAVQALFSTAAFQDIHTHCDLSGQPRVTSGKWNPL
jgi:release factor glutamine methyltransferase